jgi:hypothetical protein
MHPADRDTNTNTNILTTKINNYEEDYYCSRGIGSSWHNGIMWLNKERTVTRT